MYNFSMLVDDSFGSSLEHKIKVCKEWHISNMEVREDSTSFSITEMNGEQLEACRHLLIDHGIKIVLLSGSRPASDYEYYKRLFTRAYWLNVECIQIHVPRSAASRSPNHEV